MSELLEDRLWLSSQELELCVIVNLASDQPALNGDLSRPPLITRLRQLKRAIDRKKNKLRAIALRGTRANLETLLRLFDLWAFLIAVPQRDDPTFAWAREFCRKWA